MDKFKPAALPPEALDPFAIQKRYGCTLEAAQALAASNAATRCYMNDRYQVNVQDIGPAFGDELGDMAWLSIKRRNKAPARDWRDLQEIKNQIVGPECEGVELFPAESRLVDTANQYHLFVFRNPAVRFPFGWHQRATATPDEAARVGAVQRPFT